MDKKVLAVGRNGACLVVCDTENKFEVVSCWDYNEASQSWSQGHYFTEWRKPQDEKARQEVIESAMMHFKENYA